MFGVARNSFPVIYSLRLPSPGSLFMISRLIAITLNQSFQSIIMISLFFCDSKLNILFGLWTKIRHWKMSIWTLGNSLQTFSPFSNIFWVVNVFSSFSSSSRLFLSFIWQQNQMKPCRYASPISHLQEYLSNLSVTFNPVWRWIFLKHLLPSNHLIPFPRAANVSGYFTFIF